ncbi:hypothetical protein OROMI_014039 [Orobanche minor]
MIRMETVVPPRNIDEFVPNADRLLVKRYHGDGGDKLYLSALSPQDFSLSEDHENIDLSFYKRDHPVDIAVGTCRGLLYFDNYEGEIVLCNPTTKELKFLPPPKMECDPNVTAFFGTGLGYNWYSDDYKVVRNFGHGYYDEDGSYCGSKDVTELYSLKSDSWKEIPSPDDAIQCESGTYVSGSCYWTGVISSGFGVVSFDFITESFVSFPLPQSSKHLDYIYDLFVVHDMLGAIGYPRPQVSETHESPKIFGVSKSFELWVWKERSWAKSFVVSLCDVERPLGLKDGRFLFLEKKTSHQLSQLIVYDSKTKELEKLDIYDYPEHMKVTCYSESKVSLPDAKPINRRRMTRRRKKRTMKKSWPMFEMMLKVRSRRKKTMRRKRMIQTINHYPHHPGIKEVELRPPENPPLL